MVTVSVYSVSISDFERLTSRYCFGVIPANLLKNLVKFEGS